MTPPRPRRWAGLVAAVTVAAACTTGPAPERADDATPASPTPATGSASGTAEPPSPPGGSATRAGPDRTTTPSRPAPTGPTPPRVGARVADDELADLLTAAERAIRDPSTPPGHLARWARGQQYVYRVLADRPGQHRRVLRAVPDGLRDAVRHNLTATVELRRLTDPRDDLPDWRIVAPPPVGVLRDAYANAAAEFGLDWTHLAAIHLVETRMGRIRGTSTAGARGPMQFLPSTWEAYGTGDITDPRDAIRAAARYLADHGAPDDMARALFAYNNSDRYVRAVRHHAAVLRTDPRTYRAYHAWQVYYRLATGDVVLPVGWPAEPAVELTPRG